MSSAMKRILQVFSGSVKLYFRNVVHIPQDFVYNSVCGDQQQGNEMDLNQLSYMSELSIAAMYASEHDARVAEMILKIWDRDGKLSADQFAVVKRIVDLYGK
jgi:hypothetical protein